MRRLLSAFRAFIEERRRARSWALAGNPYKFPMPSWLSFPGYLARNNG